MARTKGELTDLIIKAERNVFGWGSQLQHYREELAAIEASERAAAPPKPRGRSGGRKQQITSEQIERAKVLAQVFSLSEVARKLKVHRRTLEKYGVKRTAAVCSL